MGRKMALGETFGFSKNWKRPLLDMAAGADLLQFWEIFLSEENQYNGPADQDRLM